MKAMTLTGYGDVDRLEMKDIAEPQTGPGEIKVRMVGAGINPIDWKLRNGVLKAMMPVAFPAVLGRDVSGEVVEVGAGVHGFHVGQRVMGLVNGGYAEYVVATSDCWVEVPALIDLVDAAALPLALLTGAQLVEDAVRPRRGDVMLVTGAVGSVGRAAIFAAKAQGVQVWAGVRTSQVTEAATLGADGVVALDNDLALANLPALNSIADTIGGAVVCKLLENLKSGGAIGTVVGEPVGAIDRGFVVRMIMTHPDADRLGTLVRAVAAGKLRIPISQRLPLAEARRAQTLAENHSGGKVILVGAPASFDAPTESRNQVGAARHA